MAEGPARLVIDFASCEAMTGFVRWLREETPAQTQPFGYDVNLHPCVSEDDLDADAENVCILVPGHRVAERENAPVLEVPAPQPENTTLAVSSAARPQPRPRGVPDQLFAPRGATPQQPRPAVQEHPRY